MQKTVRHNQLSKILGAIDKIVKEKDLLWGFREEVKLDIAASIFIDHFTEIGDACNDEELSESILKKMN